MAGPTIHKIPRKGMPPRKTKKRDLEKWKKHRNAVGKAPTPPNLKN